MNIILLGPPGAGKGTQAEFIKKELNIPHISTGDMLRAAIRKNDALGASIAATVAAGKLVSDAMMIELVQQRIAESDCRNGFILDGFPRTSSQAEALAGAGVKIDFVIQIKVPDEAIIQRLAGRRVHLESGRTYNIYFHPPKVSGVDDVTGEPLIQRDDDNEETVRSRLSVYHTNTEPLAVWYQDAAKQKQINFIPIDGTQDEQDVSVEILDRIKSSIIYE